MRGYAHVIKEISSITVLFMGTELGCGCRWRGKTWSRYKGGDLPTVAVRDLAIHPRDHDLVIGRMAGHLDHDDITAASADTADVTKGAAFCKPSGSAAIGALAAGRMATRIHRKNPPGDAVITYYLQSGISSRHEAEVLDSAASRPDYASQQRLGESGRVVDAHGSAEDSNRGYGRFGVGRVYARDIHRRSRGWHDLHIALRVERTRG